MKTVKNGFATATAVTVLDLWVAFHCGPPIWEVFGNLPWARVAILSVAGAGLFTLMDIWSRTAGLAPIAMPQEELDQVDAPQAVITAKLMEEGADV